jgi:two-component system NtrC family response regulator
MPGKILIIDDEENLRNLLARIINLEGFAITEVGTLRAAHRALEEKSRRNTLRR